MHPKLNRHMVLLGFGLCSFATAFMLFRFGFQTMVRAQQAEPNAHILLSPATVSATVGDEFTIGVGLDSPEVIVGVDTIIVFDSNMLEVVSVATGSSQLLTLAPGEGNVIDLSRAVRIASDSSASTLEFGLVAFNQATNQPTMGVTGFFDPASNPLASITFRAKAAGVVTLRIEYSSPGATTDSNTVSVISGEAIDTLSAPDAQVAITIVDVCFDFNSSGIVDVADIMQVASRWNTASGDPNYDAQFDMDNDGDIDVLDIQTVSATWGDNCP